jgi:cold shock CspA family protein
MKSRGVVARFDRATGLGEITGADGSTYPFHSTVIADGTRDISVGAEVQFDVIPGHLGRWEAAAIAPLNEAAAHVSDR